MEPTSAGDAEPGGVWPGGGDDVSLPSLWTAVVRMTT